MKDHRTKPLLLIVLLAMALHMAGCSASNDAVPLPPERLTAKPPGGTINPAKRSVTIGFTALGKFEYIEELKKNIVREASNRGVTLLNYDGNASGDQQLNDVKDMIAKKVDVIILNPVDTDKSIQAVTLAFQAGIPVVGINTIANTGLWTTYIGSNDIQAGEMIAQYMAEKLGGKGNIVVLQGLLVQSSQIQRETGLTNSLERYPKIKVLDERSARWSKTEAYGIMKEWHHQYGDDIDGVIAMNDDMALGAVAYLKEIGKQREIPVVGVDAIQDALTAIHDGDMAATLFQNAEGQAKLAVSVALTLASGGQPANSYFLPYQLVTSDNVDRYRTR